MFFKVQDEHRRGSNDLHGIGFPEVISMEFLEEANSLLSSKGWIEQIRWIKAEGGTSCWKELHVLWHLDVKYYGGLDGGQFRIVWLLGLTGRRKDSIIKVLVSPVVGGGRLGCAVVGSQREVGSGNGLSDDRVEGTREKAEMYGRPLSLGPKPWPVKS